MKSDNRTSVTETLEQREQRYGDYTELAMVAQALKQTMRECEGWQRLAPYQKQSLEAIQDKIARILNGDPKYADNWHDIGGYAALVEERLE